MSGLRDTIDGVDFVLPVEASHGCWLLQGEGTFVSGLRDTIDGIDFVLSVEVFARMLVVAR